MKQSILILMLLISSLAFSQISFSKEEKPIEIGKVAPMGMKSIVLNKYESENTYVFTYKDIKFQQVVEFKSFSFKDTDNAFENFYKVLIDGFENPPAEDIKLELPNDIVWLHFEKALGIVNVQFWSAVNKNPNIIGLSQYLTKKQVMKLFGKNS